MTIQKTVVAPFTPGPWEPYDAADETGINIGQVAGYGIIVGEQVQPQDARLIAAAPSLYAALTDCLYALTSPVAGPTDMASAATRARQAIRLVGGEI